MSFIDINYITFSNRLLYSILYRLLSVSDLTAIIINITNKIRTLKVDSPQEIDAGLF